MELHSVELAFLVRHRSERNRRCTRLRRESGRQGIDVIAVTHPDVEHRATLAILVIAQAAQQRRLGRIRHAGEAELAMFRRGHLAAELLRHGLHAIANAEHRNSGVVDEVRRKRRLGVGHRFRARPTGSPRGL